MIKIRTTTIVSITIVGIESVVPIVSRSILLINSIEVIIVVIHTSVELPKLYSKIRIGVLPMVAVISRRATSLSIHEGPWPARA
jgi:hypothetical protein